MLAPGNTGVIRLHPRCNYEQALKDIETFERLWILYLFHLNPHWKPQVNVPRHRTDKVGVFATRAPFRPNPIGLSCVRLLRVEGLKLHVAEVDLLDGSPVIDIKPYLPYADSFPEARTGWVADATADQYAISIMKEAAERLEWVQERCGINLQGYMDVQLQHDPVNTKRKRITCLIQTSPGKPRMYHLAYRTWRVVYAVDEEKRTVIVLDVRSGYSKQELEGDDDRYGDINAHREYLSAFSGSPASS